MLKQLGCVLFCASSLFAIPGQAAIHPLAPQISYDLELIPGKMEELTNITFFYIKASCTIETSDESDSVEVYIKNRSGEVNGKPVTKGDHFFIDVHNGDILTIGAESAAQVDLTSHGDHNIMAHCHV